MSWAPVDWKRRVLLDKCPKCGASGDLTWGVEEEYAGSGSTRQLWRLVWEWRERALQLVPDDYADRGLHHKWMNMDTVSAGLDDAAHELEELLLEWWAEEEDYLQQCEREKYEREVQRRMEESEFWRIG